MRQNIELKNDLWDISGRSSLTEHGLKVLKDLDRVCLLKGDIFEVKSSRITDFNLGKNAVIRYIHKEIERELTEKKDNKAEHKEII